MLSEATGHTFHVEHLKRTYLLLENYQEFAMRNTEILVNVFCLVVLEILYANGAKLPTKPSDSVCAKYRNEPKSTWSSLPKTCRIYLQSLEGDTTTADPNTPSPRIPLNIGEKEVEIEIEKEGKHNVEREMEIETESENEVDFEAERSCHGSTCTKDGTNGKEVATNGNSSSGFNQDLLRMIALLGIATVTAVTIVVIAVLVICVLRKRGGSSQPVERRKDYSRNESRDQLNGSEERPPIRNNPANTPHNHHPGRPHRPPYNDSYTTSSSARGRHPNRGVPKDDTSGYNLVEETPYASIDDRVSERSYATGREGHYYFKLESDKESFPPLSSDSSRWTTSSSEVSSNPSHSLSSKKLPRSQEVPQSCSGSNRSVGPTPSELTVRSQYDHLNHSGTHSRNSSKGSNGTSLQYDVLTKS